jgi:hypothetical protein
MKMFLQNKQWQLQLASKANNKTTFDFETYNKGKESSKVVVWFGLDLEVMTFGFHH